MQVSLSINSVTAVMEFPHCYASDSNVYLWDVTRITRLVRTGNRVAPQSGNLPGIHENTKAPRFREAPCRLGKVERGSNGQKVRAYQYSVKSASGLPGCFRPT